MQVLCYINVTFLSRLVHQEIVDFFFTIKSVTTIAMHDPVNFPVVMSQTTPNSITCLLCTKSTGVIKDFDKSAWVALRKSAIDRSEESLAASLAEKNSRILGLLEPSHTDGYHASCYRRFVALKPSSKRKRPHSEISSPEESAEFLPPASNTLVNYCLIFSIFISILKRYEKETSIPNCQMFELVSYENS